MKKTLFTLALGLATALSANATGYDIHYNDANVIKGIQGDPEYKQVLNSFTNNIPKEIFKNKFLYDPITGKNITSAKEARKVMLRLGDKGRPYYIVCHEGGDAYHQDMLSGAILVNSPQLLFPVAYYITDTETGYRVKELELNECELGYYN